MAAPDGSERKCYFTIRLQPHSDYTYGLLKARGSTQVAKRKCHSANLLVMCMFLDH